MQPGQGGVHLPPQLRQHRQVLRPAVRGVYREAGGGGYTLPVITQWDPPNFFCKQFCSPLSKSWIILGPANELNYKTHKYYEQRKN